MSTFVSFFLGLLLFSPCMAQAEDVFDPAYINTFGTGVILASNKGYPSYSNYEPEKIKFKNGICYIKPSEGTTIDLRYILPKGQEIPKIISNVKKNQAGNVKFQDGNNKVYWDFWVSHNNDGSPNFNASKPWPTKLGDIPKWEPKANVWYNISDENAITAGALWCDLSAGLYDWLPKAQPGWKIWISISYGFNYLVNAGEMETKWDPDKKQFIQIKSTGALGFAKSEPIIVGTIEIE